MPSTRVRSAAPPTPNRSPLDASADPREFDSAVGPHIPDMFRAARAVVGSDDLAWDAVQETLIRVRTGGWLPEEPVAALVHLAVKSSLHQLRCQRRRRYHEEMEGELATPCCEQDPLVTLEVADRARVVREAVAELNDEYRTVLELYAFGGEDYDSIARRLEIPIGTVRSRLSRGRAMLRERLEDVLGAA